MIEIEKIFMQEDDNFTIFVAEQKFVIGRGYEYFHSYINTPSYIESDEQIKTYFFKVMEIIGKNIAPVSKLIKILNVPLASLNIQEAVTTLCKLFTVHEHQVAGPQIIDPIILQEGRITKRMINQLINLNKDSILRPTIIILLKDNNFDRAKELLSDCPDGINIKMIYNSGKEEIYKVINCGANNIVSFLSSFSGQCYSTCSKTKREVLLNAEWEENSIVKKYSPILLKIRTNLLFDQKEEVKNDLQVFTNEIALMHDASIDNETILRGFECISKLFRVFCYDYGGQDILDAARLAKDINNEILQAHVCRYAEFLPNTTKDEREELYQEGYLLFKKNSMEDHAIYCKNNMLIEQFYSDSIDPEQFHDLQAEAVSNVPGMVGLSHIFNNVGLAYLYCGSPVRAIEFFDRGLDYAKTQDRIVQNLALESNKMIAERYCFSNINENRIRLLMRRIFDGMGTKRLPFLCADFVLNVLAVAYSQNPQLGKELVNSFPIETLINTSFATNIMGSGERVLHLQYLDTHYRNTFPLLETCKIPSVLSIPKGKRRDFIVRYGYNPFEFNTWL